MDPTTEADRIDAVRSVAGGIPVKDVAKELGLPTATVYKWCSEDGLLQSIREQRYDELVKEYRDTKISVAKLLAKYKIAQNTLYRVLAKRNVLTRREMGPSDEEQAVKVIALFKAGMPLNAIQTTTGKGFPFIYRTLTAAGLDRKRR